VAGHQSRPLLGRGCRHPTAQRPTTNRRKEPCSDGAHLLQGVGAVGGGGDDLAQQQGSARRDVVSVPRIRAVERGKVRTRQDRAVKNGNDS
jgi:hypothetical protein